MQDQLITIIKTLNGLAMIPTPDGIEEAKRRLEDDEGGDVGLVEMLEWHLCNGWQMIPPEAIGTLTDAPIISEDFVMDESGKLVLTDGAGTDACVYAHLSYTVEDPIESWSKGMVVTWHKSELLR